MIVPILWPCLLFLLSLTLGQSFHVVQTPSMDLRVSTGIVKRVAVVTGGSRGIGKGIAVTLAERGAIVYVTGRSALGTTTEEGVGGSLEETVAAIEAAGGRGIAVQCDHSNDSEVEDLFKKVEQEQGRLDILVNNAFDLGKGNQLKGSFWDQGAEAWDAMHTVGLRSHYMASCLAVPLMMKSTGKGQRPGLIANVSSFGAIFYIFNVAYGVGKAAVDRLSSDMSVELEEHNIASVSLWPGVVMTEKMKAIALSGKWEEVVGASPQSMCESPSLTGKAVASLAGDPALMERTGSVAIVAELAKEYGFTDLDNKPAPPSIRSLRYLLGAYLVPRVLPKSLAARFDTNLIPDVLIPLDWMKGQRPPVGE